VTEELLSNEQNFSSLDGLAAAAAHQLGTPFRIDKFNCK
jgi:hypothetical protein